MNVSHDDLNPLNIPSLDWLPAVALIFSASQILPSRRPLLPPFVTKDEAESVAERRRNAVEKRNGRGAQFGVEGERRQRRRLSGIALLAILEMLVWGSHAGCEVEIKRSGATALVWLVIASCTILRAPQTAPFATLGALSLLLVSGLRDLLQFLPQLASSEKMHLAPVISHLADLVIIGYLMSTIMSMPVSRGGWEAVVDKEERVRVSEGTIVDETEDMARNYAVGYKLFFFFL